MIPVGVSTQASRRGCLLPDHTIMLKGSENELDAAARDAQSAKHQTSKQELD